MLDLPSIQGKYLFMIIDKTEQKAHTIIKAKTYLYVPFMILRFLNSFDRISNKTKCVQKKTIEFFPTNLINLLFIFSDKYIIKQVPQKPISIAPIHCILLLLTCTPSNG